ncbi:MAG: leucine-rich repeat protein [Dorea sp.]|nr:leucine-rich repeat protein [Dorea sp.]
MKRRFLSILLSLTLALSMAPASLAEEMTLAEAVDMTDTEAAPAVSETQGEEVVSASAGEDVKQSDASAIEAEEEVMETEEAVSEVVSEEEERVQEEPVITQGYVDKYGEYVDISATFGNGFKWTYGYNSRTLRFYGSGSMPDFSPGNASQTERPWDEYISNTDVSLVSFEEGITYIGMSCCYNYEDLDDVVLPSSLQEIGAHAFMNCRGLGDVTLPSNLQKIGWSAFSGSGLYEVTIPESVTYVDCYAFSYCNALTYVTFEGRAPAQRPDAFKADKATIYYHGDDSWEALDKASMGADCNWIDIGIDLVKTFPDYALRTFIVKTYGNATTGTVANLKYSDIKNVKVMRIEHIACTNLKGLEIFKNLEELYVYDTAITSCNLSGNPKLKILSLEQSPSLKTVNVSGNTALEAFRCLHNKVSTIDVSKLTELYLLAVNDNLLTSLDVSKNTKLKYLFCRTNQITSMNVSMLPLLEMFDCSENKIKSLDLSKNTRLKSLLCQFNYIQNLDISMIPAKFQIPAGDEDPGCFVGSQENNITIHVKMTDAQKADFDKQVANDNYGNERIIIELPAKPINMNDFEDPLLRAYILSHYDANKDGLLSVEEAESVDYLLIDHVACKTVKGIEHFKNIWKLVIEDTQITSLDTSAFTNLLDLGASVNPKLASVNISKNSKLKYVSCVSDALTALDASGCPDLLLYDVRFNKIRTVNLASNPKLEKVYLDGNQLTSLDLSKQTALKDLMCQSNQLTALDLSKQTALTSIYCHHNRLGSLDITKTKLTDVDTFFVGSQTDASDHTKEIQVRLTKTQYNSLKNMENRDSLNYNVRLLVDGYTGSDVIKDSALRTYIMNTYDKDKDGLLSTAEIDAVSSLSLTNIACASLDGIEIFKNLRELRIKNSQLTSISLSGFNNLVLVELLNNTLLTSVTAKQCANFTTIHCEENAMESLDLTGIPSMNQINVDNNKLRTIDTSKNPKLHVLTCTVNQITALDVTKNPELTTLRCGKNEIKSLDLTKNTALYDLDCSQNNLTAIDIRNTAIASVTNIYMGTQKKDQEIIVSVTKAQFDALSRSIPDNWLNKKVVLDDGTRPVEPPAPEKPATPAAPTLANVAAGVKVTWTSVEGVDGYHIFRGTTEVFTTDDPTTTTFTDTAANKSGTTYKYTIVAFTLNNGVEVKGDPSAQVSTKYLAVPKTTLTNAASGITLKWNAITGAKSYRVYRKNGSESYKCIKTISSGSTVTYTDKTAVNGTYYTYFVRAYSVYTDGKASGNYSSYTAVKLTALTRPTISSLTNASGKKMVVKWAKNAKCTGYQVQYSTSKTFASGNKNAAAVTKNGTVSQTITGLTKGKTYYVRMRSYKTVSGVKQYSAYSATKSVKISK